MRPFLHVVSSYPGPASYLVRARRLWKFSFKIKQNCCSEQGPRYIYIFIYLFIGLFIYLLIYLFIGWLTIPHPSISFIFHHQKMVISKHREWGSRCHIDDQNWLVPRGLDASQALSELHAIGQPSPRDETRKTLPWWWVDTHGTIGGWTSSCSASLRWTGDGDKYTHMHTCIHAYIHRYTCLCNSFRCHDGRYFLPWCSGYLPFLCGVAVRWDPSAST